MQQQQSRSVLSVQQLLGQVNSGAAMSNITNSSQIDELKHRLLSAARSLDHINPPQEILSRPNLIQQQQRFSGTNADPGNIHQLMAQQQNNNNIAALMDALEDTRNVALATQARLQQVTRDLANAQNRQNM